MKILIVHGSGNSNYPSGEEKVIELEAAYLQSKGHEVKLYINRDRIGWNPLSIIWSFPKARKLKKLIAVFSPNIIHFHGVIPYLSLSVLKASKKSNNTVVQTLHNGRWLCVEGGFYRGGRYCSECINSFGFKGVKYGCGRGHIPAIFLFFTNFIARTGGRLFRWVDHFIAVSDFIMDQYIKSGFPVDMITVKNNGIDIQQLEINNISKPWDAREGIAFAGRLSISKGSMILIYLMERIRAPFHIVGSGPELDNLKKFCQQKGYENVVFWGNQSREKTLEILGGVICTVVPSQCGEAFSMVASESMALGTPVVASNVGGLASLVTAARGSVIDMSEKDQFVAAVERYLHSVSFAEEVGNSGREYIRQYLNMKNRGDALIKIYRSAIDRQHI